VTTTGMDTILKGLQSEIRVAMIKLTPSERGSERFVPYDTGAHGTLSEMTVRPRLFWVVPTKPTAGWLGTSNRRYAVDWELTIGYPAHGWEACAISDLDDIRTEINKYGGFSSQAGVAYRVVPPGDSMGLAKDDKWMWSTVKIASRVETTTAAKVFPRYQPTTETAVTVAGSPATLTSFTPTSDGSIVWSYHVLSSDGKTSRGGLLAASWDVATNAATHWDESTSDIAASGATYADTTGLVFNVALIGGVVYLKATSTGDTWTIRTTEIAKSQE
jgi:hypothetical protein